MPEGSDRNSRKKKAWIFCLFMLAAVFASVVFAAMAAEKSGMYWVGMDKAEPDQPIDNRGFFMVDVSDLLAEAEAADTDSEKTAIVPIGIGPIPSVPSLSEEELKLYGALSRGDGLISSQDKSALDEDIHWEEVVLDKGDTLDSIAKEFGISAADIRKANALTPDEKLEYSDVLYIPDSPQYIKQTLAYVKKLQLAEIALSKGGRRIAVTAYVVQNGDTLWSIANKFNLDVDTIVGSNKFKDINKLKPGSVLRIPNQDGIFIKAGKNVDLAELADRYGSSVGAVMLANSLGKTEKVAWGRELFLPEGHMTAVVETTETVVKTTVGKTKIKVRKTTESIITRASRRFRWPVMGQISSNFGWRRSPFGRRRAFHAGLDIRAPRGRPIQAAGDGRVVYAGWMSGYGKAVVVEHASGLTTLYGHCSSLCVGRGTVLHAGQVIAKVGSTGRSTGNHCHFEVRRGSAPVNPLGYLR